MTRTEYAALYVSALCAAIARDPGEYGPDAIENAPRTVARMMAALDAGTANVTGSDALRILARRLGIRHTVRDIMAHYRTLTP